MNFEDLQKTWQSANPAASVTINTDVLLNEVRRNQRHFQATIFWRDFREVGIAFLGTVFFLWFGFRRHDWTFVLLGLAGFGVGTFMVVDRLLQRKKQPAKNDTLKACIENSLHQVNHQIWLLKNVAWWYLLPIFAALAVGDFVFSRHSSRLGLSLNLIINALLFYGLHWFNQLAVRKSLEPRRQELETLLAGLDKNHEN